MERCCGQAAMVHGDHVNSWWGVELLIPLLKNANEFILFNNSTCDRCQHLGIGERGGNKRIHLPTTARMTIKTPPGIHDRDGDAGDGDGDGDGVCICICNGQ